MAAVIDQPLPRLRPMREQDLARVLTIEQAAYPFPWTRGIFSDCLNVGYSCWVLDLAGEIAGYGVLSNGAGEAHILNLCVDQPYRREGLGRYLLQRLIDLARWHQVESVFLEVRPSNHAAHQLYESFGFERVGRRPNYYPADVGREDALVMALKLRAGE